MSLSHSLANALTGLTASSRMAEVVSSNIANAMTDGYGRRSVDLSAQTIGGRGAGVQIDGITRHTDRSLVADRRGAETGLSARNAMTPTLARLETAVGVMGDGQGIDSRIMALEQALVAAGAEPSSEIRLATVVDRLGNVTEAIRSSAAKIQTLREEADQSIASQVAALNSSLTRMEQLNRDIVQATTRGEDTSALRDQRQVVVDRISNIVPIREMDRKNGEIALITPGGATLIDGRAAVIGFQATQTIVPEMTVASGGLAGLTLNGLPVDPTNGVGRLTGGTLGAAFALRDSTLVTAQAGLDAIARDLVERFQDPAIDPSIAPGDAGLLTDAGWAFDPLNGVGISSRIAVNAAVDPAQGGALWRLRDGVNAAVAGPVGLATQINLWLTALDAQRSVSVGGPARSAVAHAGALSSDISSLRLTNEEEISFSNARYARLREAELAIGVDSDAEMQMLLRIEQSYAANAKVIDTVEGLFRTLMEI
ncbi:MAG: flagellar hook-associated protein FlgK [Rhodobacterales bacterium]|jgi:flagellar hook-associated protein 1|nr:flagellar hook-associated protein FlgK [Rhodobacterales bacterium]